MVRVILGQYVDELGDAWVSLRLPQEEYFVSVIHDFFEPQNRRWLPDQGIWLIDFDMRDLLIGVLRNLTCEVVEDGAVARARAGVQAARERQAAWFAEQARDRVRFAEQVRERAHFASQARENETARAWARFRDHDDKRASSRHSSRVQEERAVRASVLEILDLKLLQIDQDTSYAAAKATYRTLCAQHHPDLGGSHEDMARINAAWDRWAKKHRKF